MKKLLLFLSLALFLSRRTLSICFALSAHGWHQSIDSIHSVTFHLSVSSVFLSFTSFLTHTFTILLLLLMTSRLKPQYTVSTY